MATGDAVKRLESWEAFAAWERRQRSPERDFASLLRWLGDSLALARGAGNVLEEPAEEKAARVARTREKLATLRRPG